MGIIEILEEFYTELDFLVVEGDFQPFCALDFAIQAALSSWCGLPGLYAACEEYLHDCNTTLKYA